MMALTLPRSWWLLFALTSSVCLGNILEHRGASWSGYDFHTYPHPQRQPALPRDVMVGVVNNLGLKLLAIHNEYNENNIAISPYGALSVLIALGEGVQGDAVLEIQQGTRVPNDISIIRVGLRDIHRHLKSYFIPKEGFLAGLTLNSDNVTLRKEYQDVLKFYGFDIFTFNNGLYPEPETTEKPTSLTGSPTERMTNAVSPEATTATSTTESMARTVETLATDMAEATTLESVSVDSKSDATDKTDLTTRDLTIPTTTMITQTPQVTTPILTINPADIGTTTVFDEKDTTTMQRITEKSPTATTTDTEIETNNGMTTEVTKTTETQPENPVTTESFTTLETTTTKSPMTTITDFSTTLETTTTESLILTTMTETPTPVETTMEISATTKTSSEAIESEQTTYRVQTTDIVETTESSEKPETTSQPTTEILSTVGNTITTLEALASTNDQTENEVVPSINPDELDTITRKVRSHRSKSEKDAVQLNVFHKNDHRNHRRKTRSLVDYIIAKYYDDLHFLPHHARAYVPEPQLGFLVNGKFREYQINFMKYDAVLPFHYAPHLNAAALSFPLDNANYYLLLLLPLDEGGVDQLICDIRLNESIQYIIDNLSYTHVIATIPNFELKGYVNLTPSIQKLGIQRIFEPRQADFSPMTDHRNVYVTNIEQAITVNIRNYMDPNALTGNKNPHQFEPIEFKVDHPFVYFVLDTELHVTLMAGKIINPLNTRIR